MPPDTRAFGYGTRLPGTPDFRGILHSQSFPLRARHLVIPFTGHPCATGNGLRWRFFNSATQQETWVSYVGPDPGVNWDVWSTDVSDHLGSEATLYLYDGREDQAGWVGVGQPAQTGQSDFAPEWLAMIRTERTDAGHTALATLALVSALSALTLFLSTRTRPRTSLRVTQ